MLMKKLPETNDRKKPTGKIVLQTELQTIMFSGLTWKSSMSSPLGL